MVLNPDFNDIFSALNAAGARYLLVGGYAVGIHSMPRFTKDLDIWTDPTPTNARRVYAALIAFGAPLGRVTVDDFATEGVFFLIGQPPNRIDIITAIDGVSFRNAWPSRVIAQYGAHTINVIGRRHLIQNKETSGRPQDLADAAMLRQFAPRRR